MAQQAVTGRPRAGDVAEVVAASISSGKGPKTPQEKVEVRVGHGFIGDAHAGDWHRQVSLLSMSSIEKMRRMGADVGPGDFAENLTLKGFDVYSLPVGTEVRVGPDVRLVITQIGKECHSDCAVFRKIGTCVMPHEGIFAKVLEGGEVHPGDRVEVLSVPGGEQAGGK